MEVVYDEFASGLSIPWQVAILRLGGAVLLCGLIGFEREARDRPAGLRTHMLVGLASALFCLIMLEVLAGAGEYSDRVAMDPLRLLEAVTSGVAFLAAGMIVFNKGKVRGLTTGTSLWLAAGIGLSAGFGMWLIAFMSCGLALVVIRLVRMGEEKVQDEEKDA